MGMRRIRAGLLGLLLLFLLAPLPAAAQPAGEQIRAVIARWYEALARRDEGRPGQLTAPGFMSATPYVEYADTGSAALGPRVYTSLAATALKFSYDVDLIRADAVFARVQVWERGYFYAWAAQKTYERGAAASFVLERQEKDGRWLILAYQTSSQGIPPNKVTDPMPNLRALYYATQGKDRDPAKDAEAARAF
ncbi:hypothetical protein ACFQ1E_12550 [Sphingomonas canadensis]|uniref:DUF4440 domain-containing protein n=1 Tax=Sphingomonas canadensis TaxID=1219257 RepID=A0ABW3H7M8_9SPHN|nr:hypothetical protein [Sphingomonas canadensis]MCW3836694.1 hypothetical protein [Sphingomonas canadensis]